MNDKRPEELFSTPTGLAPEIEISGTTFYSSKKLKDNFVVAFGNQFHWRYMGNK